MGMGIIEANRKVAEAVITWMTAEPCIVLRVSYDEKQMISGDLDVFVPARELELFFQSLNDSLSSLGYRVFKGDKSLSGSYVYVVGPDWLGFCKLDIHVREVYKNVSVLPVSELVKDSKIDHLLLPRLSSVNEYWLQYCFYLLNGRTELLKFEKAELYLTKKYSEDLPFNSIGLQLLFSRIFPDARRLQRFFLYSQLLCTTFMRPGEAITLQLNYIRYLVKKIFSQMKVLHFNGNINDYTFEVLQNYFRGQPITTDKKKGKSAIYISHTDDGYLVGDALNFECKSMVRQFLEAL